MCLAVPSVPTERTCMKSCTSCSMVSCCCCCEKVPLCSSGLLLSVMSSEVDRILNLGRMCVVSIMTSTAVGAVQSPMDCYLANRGLKTLALRMRQHQSNAFAVAKFLESNPRVQKTIYPGMQLVKGLFTLQEKFGVSLVVFSAL